MRTATLRSRSAVTQCGPLCSRYSSDQRRPPTKVWRRLSLLDVAQSPEDLDTIPPFRAHPLKGDLAGYWSAWVNGNWRVTFRFMDGDVELVDYQDYH